MEMLRTETEAVHREFLFQQEANRSLEKLLQELLPRPRKVAKKSEPPCEVLKNVVTGLRGRLEFRLPRVSVNSSFGTSGKKLKE